MAQVKISELPSASSLTGSEVLPVVQGGSTLGATVNQIKDKIQASTINVLKMNASSVQTLANIGELAFNPDTQTLEVKCSADVTLSIGQENYIRGKNSEADTILNGTVIYVSGGLGANSLIKRAGNADGTAERVIGVATQDIGANNIGFITTSGIVNKLNTSAYQEGDLLWLGTNGTMTNVKPATSVDQICIGVVLRSHANEGSILVAVKDDWRDKLAEVRSDLSETITALEQEQIQGGVYDVSSHNDGAVFESLSALLGSANLSTLIPTSVRYGGMSIRFIQGYAPNSDNKYVQYMFMLSAFTDAQFANIDNWRVDVSEFIYGDKHPKFIKAVVGKNRKFVSAIDESGKHYFPAGIESPTTDEINSRLDKINHEEDNPKYIKAVVSKDRKMVSGVEDNGTYVFPAGIKSPTIDLINERISEITREKGSRATNSIIVAASNSTQNDKNIADYTCTGQNDEDVINEALEHLPNGGTLQLMDGDYYIDSFKYSYTNGNVNYKCAIFLGYNDGNARTIILTGTTENKGYNTQHGVNLHVTKSATDNMVSSYSYTVISGTNIKPTPAFSEEDTHVVGDHVTYDNTVYKCIDDVETPGPWTGATNWAVSAYWDYTFINNISICKIWIFVYTLVGKKVIGIDCRNFGSAYLNLVGVYTESYFDDRFLRRRPATPAYGSIGVITNRTSNDEMSRVGMWLVNVGGFYTGFWFAGVDRMIAMQCQACRCCVGYQFGSDVSQALKVITLINCADEGNTHLPRFYGYTGNITIIDFNIEPSDSDNSPIDETGDTEPHATMWAEYGWKGSISYTTQGFASGMYAPNQFYFWKKPETDASGNITKIHGKHIKTTHITQTLAGDINNDTMLQNPEYLQQYFDENTNTMKTWNGKEWV